MQRKNQNNGIVSIVGLILALITISVIIYFISRTLTGKNSENDQSLIEQAEDLELQVDEINEDLTDQINEIEEE